MADDQNAELVVRARVVSPFGYALIRFLGKPFITIDGKTNAGRWGENSFVLLPGDHQLDVAFHLFKGGTVGYGQASNSVTLVNGEVTRAEYLTPWLGMSANGKMKVVHT